MQYINYYSSPLGKITLASNGNELIGLWFEGQKYFGSTLNGEYKQKSLPVFEQTAKWLDIYRQLSFAMKCGKFCSQFHTAV